MKAKRKPKERGKRSWGLSEASTFNRILYEEGLGVFRGGGRETPFPPERIERLVQKTKSSKRVRLSFPFEVLSPREREVIEGLFFGSLSEREVAGLLGISRSSVKSYKRLALSKLRKAMEGKVFG
ncbi:MAG: RNA polymerase sigma factor [Candidatus Caldatribacteriaceae bacterium]